MERTEFTKQTGKGIGAMLVGLVMGLVIGFICIGIGLILTLTVIGAIIGIPLMILGGLIMVVSPVSGLVGGFTLKKKECPYCNSPILFSSLQRAVVCGRCKKRSLITKIENDQALSLVS